MKDRACLVPARRLRLKPPARKLPRALISRRLRLLRKVGKVMDRTARFIGPRATISQECHQVEQLVKWQRAEYEKSDKGKGQNGTGGKGRGGEANWPGKAPQN